VWRHIGAMEYPERAGLGPREVEPMESDAPGPLTSGSTVCARREGLRATHAATHMPEPLTGIRVVIDHE